MLPIKRQAKWLNIGRSTVYYRPRPVSDADLAVMRRIDQIHLAHPTAGARMFATSSDEKASPSAGSISQR